MRVAARKAIEVASPQVRAHYEAYARGVNAYIESYRGRLPLEFRILRYSPQPWTPEDSTLIAAQMVKDLSASPRHALMREKILAKLGDRDGAIAAATESGRLALDQTPKDLAYYKMAQEIISNPR